MSVGRKNGVQVILEVKHEPREECVMSCEMSSAPMPSKNV